MLTAVCDEEVAKLVPLSPVPLVATVALPSAPSPPPASVVCSSLTRESVFAEEASFRESPSFLSSVVLDEASSASFRAGEVRFFSFSEAPDDILEHRVRELPIRRRESPQIISRMTRVFSEAGFYNCPAESPPAEKVTQIVGLATTDFKSCELFQAN